LKYLPAVMLFLGIHNTYSFLSIVFRETEL
jgi:hypothetical protein